MWEYNTTRKINEGFSLVKWMCGVLSALLVGGLTAWLIVPFAYAERGYRAIGGEWMLVFAVTLAAFQISNWLLTKE